MKKKAVILLVGLFALLGAACLSMARVDARGGVRGRRPAQSLYKLDIAQSRGTIYDCGLQPLVGGEIEYVAAVAPTIQAIGALEKATGRPVPAAAGRGFGERQALSAGAGAAGGQPLCRCSGCPSGTARAAGAPRRGLPGQPGRRRGGHRAAWTTC